MIDIDETLAKKNLNMTTYQETVKGKFDFSTEVMSGKLIFLKNNKFLFRSK